jgi:catechol-2,3-dioxygenase
VHTLHRIANQLGSLKWRPYCLPNSVHHAKKGQERYMLAKVVKLGFLGLNSVNHAEMCDHYSRVIGLGSSLQTSNETCFSCGGDRMSFSLHRAERAGYRHIGLKVDAQVDLKDVLSRMKATGLPVELKSDLFDGIQSCLQIQDPDGFTIFLYQNAATSGKSYDGAGIVPDKLGHVALFVSDAQSSARFYTDVLGFRWSDWLADFFVFMRCNADHHTMNFLQAPKQCMYHVAFELHDLAHLGRSCDILARNKVRILWGPGRHGMGHNLFTYHRDPDGNVVEFIAELDRMSDEALGHFDPRPYHQDFPQKPKVWSRGDPFAVNSWGAPTPPDLR